MPTDFTICGGVLEPIPEVPRDDCVCACECVHTCAEGPWKGHYHIVAQGAGGGGEEGRVLLQSLPLGLSQGAWQATRSRVLGHALTLARTHSPLGLSPSWKRVLEPARCCLPPRVSRVG